MLKKAVLFVRRSSLVSRRSQAENFISCEIHFTRDASRDTVFALADFFSILLVSCSVVLILLASESLVSSRELSKAPISREIAHYLVSYTQLHLLV